MLAKLQSAISLFTCGCLVSAAASPSSIGFMVSNGQAQVDGSDVRGNSTLFQGTVVQAGNGTSDLMLPGGSNLLLQPGSKVKVYREYAVLEHGVAIQRRTHGYALVADGLKVSSLSPQGAVVVGLKDKSHLEVAAQGGPAEVRTAGGNLVARLEPGKALSFSIQVSQQNPSSTPSEQSPSAAPVGQTSTATVQLTLHGMLHKDHAGRYGHYLLTDLATNIVYQLQGPDLEDFVGASVEVTGSIFDTPPAGGASKVMSVSDIHQMPLGEIENNATVAAETAPPAAATSVPESPATPTPATPPIEPGPSGEATPAPAPTAPPPLPKSNTNVKIIIIVGAAGGAIVGVALGLAGGKSSTVSPE